MIMASEGGGKLTNIVKVRYGSSRSEFYSDYAEIEFKKGSRQYGL